MLVPLLPRANKEVDLLYFDSVLIPMVSTMYLILMKSSTVEACEAGYYTSVNADQSVSCQQCSSCQSHEALVQPCTNTSDTLCIPCWPQGMFSSLNHTSGHRQCQDCTNCTQVHREELELCGEANDAICGRCRSGYFLGLAVGGGTVCLQCSRCPPGDVAVAQWQDCKRSGLSREYWCSPGVYPDAAPTTELATAPTTTFNYSLFLGEDAFLEFPDINADTSTEDRLTVYALIASVVCCLMLTMCVTLSLSCLLCGQHRNRARGYSYTMQPLDHSRSDVV